MSSRTPNEGSGAGAISVTVLLIVIITVVSTTTITSATLNATEETGNSNVTTLSSCLPPSISSVSQISASTINSESIAISGACFGSVPITMLLTDGSSVTQPDASAPSILVNDQTQGWSAGFGGDVIGVHIATWTDSSIQIQGLGSQVGPNSGAQSYSISPGDTIVIDVVGPGCHTLGWPTLGVPPTTPWPAACTATYSVVVTS